MITSRPKTTSIPLLALYSSLFVSQLVLCVESPSAQHQENILAALGAFAAVTTISSILRIPMRDPDLPSDQVSPAFRAPDRQLRSPEDNLTLWQFDGVMDGTPHLVRGDKAIERLRYLETELRISAQKIIQDVPSAARLGAVSLRQTR